MKVSYDKKGFLKVVWGGTSTQLDFYAMRSHEYGTIHLFSPNQKLQNIIKTAELINSYDVDDCPERLRQLLSTLKEVC